MSEVMATLPVVTIDNTLHPVATAVTTAQRGINSVAATVGKLRDIRIDPHETGKMGTFMVWGGLVLTMLGKAAEERSPTASNFLRFAGSAGVVGGAINGVPATIDYLSTGFGPSPQQPYAGTSDADIAAIAQYSPAP
jgi:hypothetical protein